MAAPLFCFGIVADVQYAEKNNVQIDGGMRRYREALQKLRQVVVSWNGQREQLSFALNLGDSVDGNETMAMSIDELELVATEFDGLDPELPIHHVVGNHCLTVPRQHLLQRLRIPNPGYYSLSRGQGGMCPGWRLVVLDTTEMSLHSGYEEGHPLHDEAAAFELQHPISEHPQMSSWNGGIGAGQMEWLRGQLAAAREAGERVIVACHHPLDDPAAPTTHLAWNYADIKQLLRSSGCVVLVLSGHFHSGGYSQWEGIHFVTVEAVLEAPEDSNAYGIVSVSDATIDITGFGSCTSRTLPIA